MKSILQAFGRLLCGLKKQHVWSRPDKEGIKFCKRCPAMRAVKRRKASKFDGQKTLTKDSGLI